MSTRKASHRGAAALLLTVLCLFPVTEPLAAGGRRRVLAAFPAVSDLSLVFLDSGMVELGTMASPGSRRPAVTKKTITMRIGAASREPRGTATLRAFLETPDPRCTIRIDGIRLSAAPQVIQRHAPIGVPFTHRLEIEVPLSVSAGPLHTGIGWEITTE